ncbi:MAG: hypothetical protein JW929_11285 [Anaerolineales bacterium]|nr:hypothetical protein [Anaerolineales bacterium]
MEQDTKYLTILSIFHYVVAGIAGLLSCTPIFHLLIGISMLTGSLFAGSEFPDSFPAGLFGLAFTAIPAIIILAGWAFAICLGLAGFFLSQKRHYYFCLVMAGISCIFTPFGTVLGIFTIIVLMQTSVRKLFGQDA